jgi:hypothetical protein
MKRSCRCIIIQYAEDARISGQDYLLYRNTLHTSSKKNMHTLFSVLFDGYDTFLGINICKMVFMIYKVVLKLGPTKLWMYFVYCCTGLVSLKSFIFLLN